MKSTKIRVRFAPSPTGLLHIGNVRAALINHIFARKNNGKIVLRIEDTDTKRNIDEGVVKIIKNLKWLGIEHDEGPRLKPSGGGSELDPISTVSAVGGFGPYFQSERKEIYQEKLDQLIELERAYRCFCSPERLEEKRKECAKIGQPPRYDRTCLNLSREKVKAKIAAGLPFIWRFRISEQETLDIR